MPYQTIILYRNRLRYRNSIDLSQLKVTIKADKGRDVHRDIIGSLKNDISSMTCTCIN